MNKQRPFALSIAGFDPSGGAGVLADVKTFENNGVYGFGVCSALTIQNDREFHDIDWIHINTILEQIKILQKQFNIAYFKIGLIENFFILHQLIQWIRSVQPDAVILWDPILKASAGFEFHKNNEQKTVKKILKNITLITPNIPEVIQLSGLSIANAGAAKLSKYCHVYLKGGHGNEKDVTDILYSGGKEFSFVSKKIKNGEKHGSGCVLSAAILSNLAKGNNLEKSCKMAKKYIHQFLSSNETLLGYHM